MKLPKPVIDELVVPPGTPASLASRSTNETRYHWLDPNTGTHPRELAAQDLEEFRQELATMQELLYASDRYALLVIFQALDAAGKDGTIKHVMSGVNPQGCRVMAFKTPSAEEASHDFLWRCVNSLPARGQIGIYNRSYFEEVLITRVHPDILDRQRIPLSSSGREDIWKARYDDINAFERHLDRNGTRVIKFFLHVSKEEQKRRLLQRLEDPNKYWKFSAADLAERQFFDNYMRAYEDAITATSTPWAPWYVVPADHKYSARALVGGVLAHVIESLDLQLPPVREEMLAEIDAARDTLLGE